MSVPTGPKQCCVFPFLSKPSTKIIIISILQVRKLPVVTLMRSSIAECSLENNEVHYTPLWHMTCLNINKCFCIESTSLWKSFVPKFHLSLELPHIILPWISLSAHHNVPFSLSCICLVNSIRYSISQKQFSEQACLFT